MEKCHDCNNQSTRDFYGFKLCGVCYDRCSVEAAKSEVESMAAHRKWVEKLHKAWLDYVGIRAEDYGRVTPTEEQNRRSKELVEHPEYLGTDADGNPKYDSRNKY